MKRLTNKRIIEELFPILKQEIKNINDVKPTRKDFYGHPVHIKYVNLNEVRFTFFEDAITIEVTKNLKGRYDHATVSVIYKDNEFTYGYSKEFRNMGNGFYANLDENGKITKSEWD